MYQNLTFHDSVGGETVDYGNQDNWIAKADGTPSIELGKFLSRPTRIANFTWSSANTSGSVINNIDPWFEFLNNTVIKRKIENFAFIRGDLHLKININASPFYYGLARTYYTPLEGVSNFSRIDYTNATQDIIRLQTSGRDCRPNSYLVEKFKKRLLRGELLNVQSQDEMPSGDSIRQNAGDG
jgi:hypothetical protein